MFKNEYQGGTHVEIFSAQGKDPVAKWKLTGGSGIRKVYDKQTKGYVYSLEGTSTTARMQIPKDSKINLMLLQRFIVLQIYIPIGQDFSVEIGVTDTSSVKRRIALSTAQKDVQVTTLHARLPLSLVKRAVWLHLGIDILSLVPALWKGHSYKVIDCLTVCANCRLRRLFTMKCQPTDTTGDNVEMCGINDGDSEEIPPMYKLPSDLTCITQVITFARITSSLIATSPRTYQRTDSSDSCGSILSSNSSRRNSKEDNKGTHIAFGSRVPIPEPVTSKKRVSSGPKRPQAQGENIIPQPPQERPRQSRSAEIRKRQFHVRSAEQQGSSTLQAPTGVPKSKSTGNISITNASQSSSEESSKSSVRSRRANVHKLPPSSTPVNRRLKNDKESKDLRLAEGDSVEDIINSLNQNILPMAGQIRRVQHKGSNGDMTQRGKGESPPDRLYRFESPPSVAPHRTISPVSPVCTPAKKEVTSSRQMASPESDFVLDDDAGDALSDQSNRSDRRKPRNVSSKNVSQLDGKLDKQEANRTNAYDSDNYKTPTENIYHSDNYKNSLGENPVEFVEKDVVTVVSTSGAPTCTAHGQESKLKTRTSVNRKTLRELSNEEVRQSLTLKKPELRDDARDDYDASKYQMQDLTASYEARMLELLRREENEDAAHNDPESENTATAVTIYENSLQSTGGDTGELMTGTWKPPLVAEESHYEDEMLQPSPGNTLNTSNPREWTTSFSPSAAVGKSVESAITRDKLPAIDAVDSEQEEDMLDLLYDPSLNCYFDPKTQKYYELA